MRKVTISLLGILLLLQSTLAMASMHLCLEPAGRTLCADAASEYALESGSAPDKDSSDAAQPAPHQHHCCSSSVVDFFQEARLEKPEPILPRSVQLPVFLLDVHFDIFHPPA